MRAVVGCAIVSVWLAVAVSGRAEVPRFAEPMSCQEQCRVERARDDAACDAGPLLGESDRALCHDAVRARLDVCLRICDD